MHSTFKFALKSVVRSQTATQIQAGEEKILTAMNKRRIGQDLVRCLPH